MRVSSKRFRVHLQSLVPEDAAQIAKQANDSGLASYMPGMPHPYLTDHAMNLVSFAIDKYRTGDEFHMGVRLGNELIGLCALSAIDAKNSKAELGYWLGRSHWGRGYGKEMLTLMLGLGFGRFGLNRIYSHTLTGNTRSIKLLESLGFKNEGTGRQDVHHLGRFADDYTFSILRGEWHGAERIAIDEP